LYVFAWQQTPLRADATYPYHRFKELAAFGLIAQISIWVFLQEIPNFRPLFVS